MNLFSDQEAEIEKLALVLSKIWNVIFKTHKSVDMSKYVNTELSVPKQRQSIKGVCVTVLHLRKDMRYYPHFQLESGCIHFQVSGTVHA